MERPSGPLGAATQSSRPFDPNGLGRLPPLPPITVRRAPNPNSQRPSTSSIASSNSTASSNLTALAPISASQVIALAREAMKSALEENQTKAAEASAVSNALKPGVTIDLSHRGIQRFPDEVVDIIKNELERLALSHNQITTFPLRFAECTSLRYLNVRNNLIREFPQCICQLKSLEILDLGRNKLRILPPELASLTSLKVLSVQKNRIEDLPLCLADMSSLQVLKLDGNPVRFPPKEIMAAQSTSPPNGGFVKDNEIDEVAITSQIKRYLKQKAMADRSEAEFGADEESSEGAETPRPAKRVMSGRFPVKVNGTDMSDLRSPALPRPPPIPSRSHYRGLSQQNTALRRPGVMPLTIGNSNERLRSNSEGFIQATRDRPKQTRLANKKQELDTVDEGNSNRYSHYRGLSHGSAISGSNSVSGNANLSNPSSPADVPQRPIYVRRLSSLPERKRESRSPDPVMEGAKGILYALFQIHPLIQSLIGLVRDGNNKRTSLERVFYNASTHVEELDRDIQSYSNYSEEDEELSPLSNETVQSACLTCISAYLQVCSLLSRNMAALLDNGDPRYIRTLLLMVYGSLAEVRNAGASLFVARPGQRTMIQPSTNTIRPYPRDKSLTPTRERPNPAPRTRATATIQNGTALRVATDVPQSVMSNGQRSHPIGSVALSAATPRSGESFVSLGGSANGSRAGMSNGEFTREDQLFERIFLQLQQSSELGLQTLPLVNNHFVATLRQSNKVGNQGQLKQLWQILTSKCVWALQTAEILKGRLSTIKLKEPGLRTQGQFWEICNSFIQAYTELVIKVKEVRAVTSLLPIEVIVLLKPLQKAIRDTGYLIQTSPWASLASSNNNNNNNNTNGHSSGPNSASALSPPPQTPLPMTPQSAALGPAVMATVPSTPYENANGSGGPGTGGNGALGMSYSNNSYSNSAFNIFTGNVFERADALLSISSASSRSVTMTSAVSNMDGSMTPASLLSPMGSMNSRFGSSGNVSF